VNKPIFNDYNRDNALAYAFKWAMNRNPQFYDYSEIGGDCTNFASQVLLAGGSLMNYDPIQGWYYINANQKSPSWTGVNFLCNFLTSNHRQGPFAEIVTLDKLKPGDIIQLSFQGNGKFDHSLVVTKLGSPFTLERTFVTTHSPNRINEKITTYTWKEIRFIHILAAG
jgi:hypothetical protein